MAHDLPGIPSATNPTIYTSVTQKLRKERGQHLDNFISSFMQSIEFVPDLADDAAVAAELSKQPTVQLRKKTPPGRNLVFGDLFELRRSLIHSNSTHENGSNARCWSSNVRGASKCLVFICKSSLDFDVYYTMLIVYFFPVVHILNAPKILIRMVLSLITISRSTVDRIIGKLINRLLQYGLYEPRLTVLITSLERMLH